VIGEGVCCRSREAFVKARVAFNVGFAALWGVAGCAPDHATAPQTLPEAPQAAVGVTDLLVAVREPIDLGNLTTQPGTLGSMAFDVNSSGWVVGEAHTATGATRAFLWKPGSGMQDLGTLKPTDTFSRASAINDAGWVVGTSGASDYTAVLWKPGDPPVALGVPGGSSEALDINNAGQIVGAYQVGSATRAFSWENGTFRELATLGGGEARALGVNDAGVVVGGSRKANSIGEEAVAWRPGETAPHDLGVTAAVSAERSAATEINNRGEVVGFAFPLTGGLAPFIFRPGSGASLLAEGSSYAGGYANAIDDAGHAVGYLAPDAILWDPVAGQIKLPKLAGAIFPEATGISNTGYIAGRTQLSHLAVLEMRAVRWQIDKPPVANPGGPYTGAKKKPVEFDGTRSSDPEGDALTYVWDFGDGSPFVGGATATHEYGAWGSYRVTLKVWDSYGVSATTTTTAIVAPPGHLKKPNE